MTVKVKLLEIKCSYSAHPNLWLCHLKLVLLILKVVQSDQSRILVELQTVTTFKSNPLVIPHIIVSSDLIINKQFQKVN